MKKNILGIVIVILIIIFAIFLCNVTLAQNIKVSDAQFPVPSGYDVNKVSTNLIKINSSKDSYFINGNLNDTNINDVAHRYINHKLKAENKTVDITNLTVNDIDVTKSVVSDNPQVVHYWFEKNGKIYEIYTGSANAGSDELIFGMIKS